ncbi:hypothetical protein Tco_1320487 [Tanacetum coccineum]
MPSLVTHASQELLDSASSFDKQKRTPEEDLMTSQMHPEAKSNKVRTRIGIDHRNTTVVISDPASQTLEIEPIATNDAAPYCDNSNKRATEPDIGYQGLGLCRKLKCKRHIRSKLSSDISYVAKGNISYVAKWADWMNGAER